MPRMEELARILQEERFAHHILPSSFNHETGENTMRQIASQPYITRLKRLVKRGSLFSLIRRGRSVPYQSDIYMQ